MTIEPLQAVILAVQGWTCKELISLKIELAKLTSNQNKKDTKMKTIKSIALLFVMATVALWLGGCSTPEGKTSAYGGLLQGTSEISYETNSFPSVDSVPVVEGGVTNLVTVTNTVEKVSMVTNIVYVANPLASGAIETGKAYAPLIPQPYGTGVELGLGAASAILAWLVRQKNGQNKSLAGQLTAVIQGVETASKLGAETKVKSIISEKAQSGGVSGDLHASVQSVTNGGFASP